MSDKSDKQQDVLYTVVGQFPCESIWLSSSSSATTTIHTPTLPLLARSGVQCTDCIPCYPPNLRPHAASSHYCLQQLVLNNRSAADLRRGKFKEFWHLKRGRGKHYPMRRIWPSKEVLLIHSISTSLLFNKFGVRRQSDTYRFVRTSTSSRERFRFCRVLRCS